MTHGSLFSGIGGFDLAAQWMGWENKFHCEWNEFGQKVLNHYWPDAELFKDITKSDFTKYANTIDVLSGGFPCQPYSQAGKRLGKDDDRHLWPEMLRAIREIQPGYVVGENVRGLTNWNGGMVFDEVQADLEAEGYEVTPFLLPACAVNAPHRRDRIWFVAYNSDKRLERRQPTEGGEEYKINRANIWQDDRASGKTTTNPYSNGQHRSNSEHEKYTSEGREYAQRDIKQMGEYAADTTNEGLEGSTRSSLYRQGIRPSECSNGNAPNTSDTGLQGCQVNGSTGESGQGRKQQPTGLFRTDWEKFPTQSPLCSRNDGISTELSGITFSKHRNESIKAYGNAVVPSLVYQIFKTIELFDQ